MNEESERSEDEKKSLGERLAAVEAEHAQLIRDTMGLRTLTNPDLIGRSKDLEREADEIRDALGIPRRGAPDQSAGETARGWLLLGGAAVALMGTILLLTR